MKLGWVTLLSACACATTVPEPRLEYGRLKSAAVGEEMRYAVYTPPDWDVTREELPLVVFLHGGGDREDCFDRAGVGQHLDSEIRAGRAPRAIIVVPEGRLGFWENWFDGSFSYRDWVVRELVPRVQAQYRTRHCPAGCFVAGISMGGHGALRFAVLESETFDAVAAISAPIVDTQQMIDFSKDFLTNVMVPTQRVWGPTDDVDEVKKRDLFLRWRGPKDVPVRLMLAWGDDDRPGLGQSNEKLSKHLTERGIPHETLVFAGPHKWRAWTPMIPNVLRFLVRAPRQAASPARP